ncbi:MAG: hypothetical protein AABY22_07835 [Nanoarchaeota archaeon]
MVNTHRQISKLEFRGYLELLTLELPHHFSKGRYGELILEYKTKYGKDYWLNGLIHRTEYLGGEDNG